MNITQISDKRFIERKEFECEKSDTFRNWKKLEFVVTGITCQGSNSLVSHQKIVSLTLSWVLIGCSGEGNSTLFFSA